MMTQFQVALAEGQRNPGLIYKDETEEKGGREDMGYWDAKLPFCKGTDGDETGAESLSSSESLIRLLVRTDY